MKSRRYGTSDSSQPPPLTDNESDIYSESEGDSETDDDSDFRPEGLDQAWDYSFKRKQNVWVMRSNRWWYGHVVRIKTDSSWSQDGVHYLVQYGGRFRAWFSPLEGVMKPNTRYIRQLLRGKGYLGK
ncbi:hypothetical protein CERSUDRAFT_101944 [Gelatoporia subvermispora B]|uniref:Uncharacterized protein n=1 Tax=Ceriporiopsis subvermispora (strain B) TaxID=914234 RepID=M2QWM5_CERS8|nr:hypothetical protein CERSUDRAFT_101944 [Gelatoporia subvermispora B]